MCSCCDEFGNRSSRRKLSPSELKEFHLGMAREFSKLISNTAELQWSRPAMFIPRQTDEERRSAWD